MNDVKTVSDCEISAQIRNLAIEGNVVPMLWFQNIRFDNGKPDPIAITLLADIVYWYRPKEIRDEGTGQVVGLRKKFRADFLQKSYQSYVDLFGFSKIQVVDALKRLESHGLIRKHFRTLTLGVGKVSNVLFIELFPDALCKITTSPQVKQEGKHDQVQPLPSSKPIGSQRDLDTNTKTTQKINTEICREKKTDALQSMLEIWTQIINPQSGVHRMTTLRRHRLLHIYESECHKDIEEWRSLCKGIAKSDFLMGKGRSNWKVSLDWAIRPENLTKILEGNYDHLVKTTSEVKLQDVPDDEAIAQEIESAIADQSKPEVWRKVLLTLRKTLSDASLKSWILPLDPYDLEGAVVQLRNKSRFLCTYINQNFDQHLSQAFKLHKSDFVRIEYKVADMAK